jgi:hypothetical protein
MDILLNASALKIFDRSVIDDIVPDDSYPVWKKEDPFGRVYYGVGNFCGLDRKIREDTDLSWLEWDGNELHLSDKDKDLLFRKAVGIINLLTKIKSLLAGFFFGAFYAWQTDRSQIRSLF